LSHLGSNPFKGFRDTIQQLGIEPLAFR